MDKTKTAAIYARYSSSNQREESIDAQLRICRKYAEENGYSIVKEYTDSAISGRTDQRPAFQQMIQDSAKGTISNEIRTFAEFKDTPRCYLLQAETQEFPSASEKSEVFSTI